MSKITPVSIQEFLKVSAKLPILDARSEGEFAQGHICGAINFPILNNEERALVGTCYKQKGHEKAVLLGYELAGPKFHLMIADAYKRFPDKKILLHCFRGGLRSRILSYVLHTAGFDITLLVGGYKVYRKYILETLEQELKLKVIGGFTGSEKTIILNDLKKHQQQIIDIEALANHRGSAYGAIGLPPQPTQEQFENDMANAISQLDSSKNIWVEDESRMTGKLKMPDKFYDQLRNATLYFIDKSFDERAQNILNTYGKFDKIKLTESTQKLAKRLGDLKLREAIAHLENNEMEQWLKIVLAYYDKTYLHGMQKRDEKNLIRIEGENILESLLTQSHIKHIN